MAAALSDRDREILSAWMHGSTGVAALADEVGLDIHELMDWAARPEIAAAINAIHEFALARARTFSLACKSASLARLLHIVERSEDEQSARRAATAILRFSLDKNTGPTSPGRDRPQPGREKPATTPRAPVSATVQPPAPPTELVEHPPGRDEPIIPADDVPPADLDNTPRTASIPVRRLMPAARRFDPPGRPATSTLPGRPRAP